MNMVDGLEVMSQGRQQQPQWAGTQWADTTSHPICESDLHCTAISSWETRTIHHCTQGSRQAGTKLKGKGVQPGSVHIIQMSHMASMAHSYTSVPCSVCMWVRIYCKNNAQMLCSESVLLIKHNITWLCPHVIYAGTCMPSLEGFLLITTTTKEHWSCTPDLARAD